MTISEIYTQYRIMPSLQVHMLRVAGVGEIICENIGQEVNRENVVTACLLHDMGNIIKFNLALFPDFLEPEGLGYWEKVKNDFIYQYGLDEHAASLAIVKEIGVSERVSSLVDAVSFLLAEETRDMDDVERKVCAYADMRVEPQGVTSLEQRLIDGSKRFRINKPGEDDKVVFQRMARALKEIEGQLFAESSIRPEEITEEKVREKIEALRQFKIS